MNMYIILLLWDTNVMLRVWAENINKTEAANSKYMAYIYNLD